ncbi:hypothetical protein HK099_002720, partial [Clydaea vesicula]
MNFQSSIRCSKLLFNYSKNNFKLAPNCRSFSTTPKDGETESGVAKSKKNSSVYSKKSIRAAVAFDILRRNSHPDSSDDLETLPNFADITKKYNKGISRFRVPANQIISLPPGEVFVHRNIANIVSTSDINCLSVLQYAVEVLKVEHIMIVGHYGCGGVRYSMTKESSLPIVDVWLRTLKDLYEDHKHDFEKLPNEEAKTDLLCELNVANSVLNVCRNSIIQKAWQQGQKIS